VWTLDLGHRESLALAEQAIADVNQASGNGWGHDPRAGIKATVAPTGTRAPGNRRCSTAGVSVSNVGGSVRLGLRLSPNEISDLGA
jgi:hypothetical protein